MRLVILLLVACAILLTVHMRLLASAEPVIRHARYRASSAASPVAPIRLALLTDLHVSPADLASGRLDRVIARVNGARPDLILLGGDYTDDELLPGATLSIERTISPLARLHARLGVVAVLGTTIIAAARLG